MLASIIASATPGSGALSLFQTWITSWAISLGIILLIAGAIIWGFGKVFQQSQANRVGLTGVVAGAALTGIVVAAPAIIAAAQQLGHAF